MTAGIGHNNGPTMEKGHRWRTYQWRTAQKKLMPRSIPLMVVKMRMRRAKELGLSYKAYASVRQATGRDICGLLFSSNALRIVAGDPAMPPERRYVVSGVAGAQRLAMVHPPLNPGEVAIANPLEAADHAPSLRLTFSETSTRLRDFVTGRKLCSDQVLVIGETSLEQEWLSAARAAGYLPADRYFVQA